MRSTFTFNGHKCDEFGIYISKKPQLNRSQRKFKSASVAGRNGNIYQFQDAWDEVVVTYDIFAGGYEKGDAPRDFTAIMEWLNSADDYARLEDSFDTDHYRMAVFVDATNIEQKWYSTGQAQIKFRCKPQHYLVGEVQEVEDGDTITNPTNHVALPIITLTGAGARSLLDLEKPIFETDGMASRYFTSPFVLSDYMGFFYHAISQYTGKKEIYRYSASGASSHNCTLTTHDNSTGTLTFTPKSTGDIVYGVGTAINVLPDTDYTVSCETTAGESQIWVAFYSTTQNNDIGQVAEKTINEAGTLTLTFHTPEDCLHLWIGFLRPDKTAGTFSNIMLASGQSAQAFRPYAAHSLEELTIGNTTLQILLNGFGEAVIDCERENFSADGADNNIGVSVLDQYGNLSVDYLKLDKGDNQINFSAGITSVLIDCRFWEL